ncbi:hypothetical protein HK098_005008, partial [Nowakowskiella sp. JEL0407]
NNFAISMDETIKHVFEQVFSSKQLTSHYCLLAPLKFLLGMQCKSTNPNEVRQIFTHHFAHLFVRKNVSLMTDGTENDAADKWIANSSFSAPEEDILLYFFLTGGKGYPALWDQDGQKVPYRFFVKKLMNSVSYKQNSISFKNTNQRSNDGMEYEAMLSVVICVASHEGGFAGTPLRIFLAEMLYNFRKDRPLHLITFIDENYTKFFEPIDDLIIPFLSPPNTKWPNLQEVDLRAGPSFAGESKDWEGGLTTEVLKNIVLKIPKNARLFIILTKQIQGSYFTEEDYEEFAEDEKIRPLSFVKLRVEEEANFEMIKGLPKPEFDKLSLKDLKRLCI